MEYIKVCIESTHESCEVLADAIAEVTGGCQVEDPKFFAEFISRKEGKWDYVDSALMDMDATALPIVSFSIAADAQGEETLRQASLLVARLKEEDGSGFYGSLKITVQPVENQDWQTSWREFFHPFTVGDRLLVSPGWETPVEEPGRKTLWIDPSVSFGTGTHASSRMCLTAVEAMDIEGMNVLDFGCGSGILACGALMCGAGKVVCCDVEEDALRTTEENMKRNNLESYTLICGDALTQEEVLRQLLDNGPYDVILANIVADVHIEMAGQYKKLMKRGGRIILSGIIESRTKEVEKAFLSKGYDVDKRCQEGEWIMLELTR